MAGERYLRPGWFTRHIFNGAVAGLTRLGISVAGSRELRVRGRTSGEWRTVPVNLLTIGGGELRVGRRIEEFGVHELDLARIAPGFPVFEVGPAVPPSTTAPAT